MIHANITNSNRNQYLYAKVLYFQVITKEQGRALADELVWNFWKLVPKKLSMLKKRSSPWPGL